MQNQMAFQNKMRALKQQELNKYNKTGTGGSNDNVGGTPTDPTNKLSHEAKGNDEQHRRPQGKQYQGAGESGGVDTAGRDRTHSMSLGEEDDFWNTSVVDEELFDFLMNN
jgi:hypothetical protein